MKISVKENNNTTVFELNKSPAARDLYAQLPLSVTVENYGNSGELGTRKTLFKTVPILIGYSISAFFVGNALVRDGFHCCG